MEYALWIIFIAVMFIIEASTVNLITIWFAAGGLAAIFAKALGAGFAWQIAVMLVVAAISLIAARPFIKNHRNVSAVATNADRVIGQTGIVTEDISEGKFAGVVTVEGKEWSAISENGEEISSGTKVKIKSINGVKLMVEKF